MSGSLPAAKLAILAIRTVAKPIAKRIGDEAKAISRLQRPNLTCTVAAKPHIQEDVHKIWPSRESIQSAPIAGHPRPVRLQITLWGTHETHITPAGLDTVKVSEVSEQKARLSSHSSGCTKT